MREIKGSQIKFFEIVRFWPKNVNSDSEKVCNPKLPRRWEKRALSACKLFAGSPVSLLHIIALLITERFNIVMDISPLDILKEFLI